MYRLSQSLKTDMQLQSNGNHCNASLKASGDIQQVALIISVCNGLGIPVVNQNRVHIFVLSYLRLSS